MIKNSQQTRWKGTSSSDNEHPVELSCLNDEILMNSQDQEQGQGNDVYLTASIQHHTELRAVQYKARKRKCIKTEKK